MQSKILAYLKSQPNEFVSGAKISQVLQISRQAVSKHIQKLKINGYDIESVSRKGHRLLNPEEDKYNFMEINHDNSTTKMGKSLIFLDSVDSTNDYLKKIALHAEDMTVVIADEQTAGKGRLGRTWTSKKGAGIWMSVLLKPDIEPASAPKITLIAAAAMTLAIEKVTPLQVGIKWPNDLVISSKKVCGVLTEMSAELGNINYIVVGLGVNVNQEEFSEELFDKATSLKIEHKEVCSRKKIVLEFLKHFEDLYVDFLNQKTLEKTLRICKSRSVLLNKEVWLTTKASKRKVKVIDLNEEGHLMIENSEKKTEEIFYGEVSVRGLNGYVDER